MKNKVLTVIFALFAFLMMGNVEAATTSETDEETYSVVIVHRDSQSEIIVAGATITMKDENGKVVETWVSTKEGHKVSGLTAGKYTLEIVSAPEGYELSKDVISFAVIPTLQDGREVTIYSKAKTANTKVGTITVTNIDAATKKPVAGTTLTLKDANGKVVETWVTDKKAHTITGLKPGTYTLIVEKTTAGYDVSNGVVKIEIDDECDTISEVTIRHTALPETADGIMLIFAGFALTIATGAFGMYKLSKQN